MGEFEIYMTESSAFLFYGMENFFTYIPSSKIASLTFEGMYSPFSVIILSVLQITFSVFSFHRLSDGDVVRSNANQQQLRATVEDGCLKNVTNFIPILHTFAILKPVFIVYFQSRRVGSGEVGGNCDVVEFVGS